MGKENMLVRSLDLYKEDEYRKWCICRWYNLSLFEGRFG